MYKYLVIGLFTLMSHTCFSETTRSNQNQDYWSSYLDGSVGKTKYYLYDQVMNNSFNRKGKYRALDLGAGAGDIDVALAELGWDVTSVDTSLRSGEIINARMKYIHGNSNFHLSDFENAPLDGDYDLVVSFFALPFGNKNNLSRIIGNISNHMKSKSLFAATFFGPEHTYVKNGQAYGISMSELISLLTLNGFELQYSLNRFYSQTGVNNEPVNWDVLDVIAKKL